MTSRRKQERECPRLRRIRRACIAASSTPSDPFTSMNVTHAVPIETGLNADMVRRSAPNAGRPTTRRASERIWPHNTHTPSSQRRLGENRARARRSGGRWLRVSRQERAGGSSESNRRRTQAVTSRLSANTPRRGGKSRAQQRSCLQANTSRRTDRLRVASTAAPPSAHGRQ